MRERGRWSERYASYGHRLKATYRYVHVQTTEGRAFHRKCVREYSELIEILSELY